MIDNYPAKAWERICERAGLKDLRIHDLRRTLGSWQAAIGARLPIIGKTLGHRNQVTSRIYARLNLDPVRQSVDVATWPRIAPADYELPLDRVRQSVDVATAAMMERL